MNIETIDTMIDILMYSSFMVLCMLGMSMSGSKIKTIFMILISALLGFKIYVKVDKLDIDFNLDIRVPVTKTVTQL